VNWAALGVAVIGTLLTSQFIQHLHRACNAPRTVAAALTAIPTRHEFVIAAYTDSAGAALKIVAVITIAAGALAVAEMATAAYRSKKRGSPDVA
jgi:hypothetical protein